MLVFKCARCKKKLWKYLKIGKGSVVRIHKSRISKHYMDLNLEGLDMDEKIFCTCGQPLGNNKGSFISVAKNSLVSSGSKENKR
ncbi:hypothetical protein [Endozoicomonas arenosclerae]|uniref:hypothetical protein n=1 Tax=Endozoicomonas arenosclerae TaxID=1633495 RepID=UPI000781C008|nr:hypothetical protein [Endozoicomonas arenosclerae]